MIFRWILAPMLGIAGLLCFFLGALSLGLHIWSHLPILKSASVAAQFSAFDGAMLLFFGSFLTAIGALFFDVRGFRRLSEILQEYVPSGPTWPLNLPTRPLPPKTLPSISLDELQNKVVGPFVFVSYSHEDKAWRETLLKWLSRSLSDRGWSVWTDNRLTEGHEWTPQLEWAIDHSSIALCLVTQHFVASDYITGTELPALRQRPENANFGIDWIPISDAMVETVQLDRVQALWSPTVPVSSLEPHQQQKALREIVLKLLKKAVSRQESAPDPPRPTNNN